MTSAHYLRQEEYLRRLLHRFATYLGSRIEVTDAEIEKFILAQPRSVVALIQNQDGRFLAVSRPNRPNDLGLPGGKIDPGELPEEAIVREVLEETGLTINEPSRWQHCYTRIDPTDGRVTWCYYFTWWSGEPRQCEEGVLVKWVDSGELVADHCTFREYNRGLLEMMASLKESAR